MCTNLTFHLSDGHMTQKHLSTLDYEHIFSEATLNGFTNKFGIYIIHINWQNQSIFR